MAATKKKKNKAYFSPELFDFLKGLEKHNDKVWFEKNRPRYEEFVKAPLLEFIGDFAGPLKKISKHFVADPRPNGGSMFRIYRDVRFSKDKSPYKLHAAAHFRHEEIKHVHAPGFYLHLQPKECFIGIGLWHPDPPTLGKIRDAIAEDSTEWKKMLANKAFRGKYELRGEKLARPPRGYDPDHTLIEDLKRKDFIAVANFTEKEVCAPGFMDDFTEASRAAQPFMKFLTEAVGLRF
jgi:uncharacterized protein (TIGR02453 family)